MHSGLTVQSEGIAVRVLLFCGIFGSLKVTRVSHERGLCNLESVVHVRMQKRCADVCMRALHTLACML